MCVYQTEGMNNTLENRVKKSGQKQQVKVYNPVNKTVT